MSTEQILSSDGIPLEISLKKAERKNKLRAMLLVGPLFLFLLITYIVPIGDMLFRSVDDRMITKMLPNTFAALEKLDGKDFSMLENSGGIIVPGGFGGRGIEGKIHAIKYAREKKIPFLGICLGMQLLLSDSKEFGFNEGLNLIPGSVIPIPKNSSKINKIKIPHIGWNQIFSYKENKTGNFLKDSFVIIILGIIYLIICINCIVLVKFFPHYRSKKNIKDPQGPYKNQSILDAVFPTDLELPPYNSDKSVVDDMQFTIQNQNEERKKHIDPLSPGDCGYQEAEQTWANKIHKFIYGLHNNVNMDLLYIY